MSDAARAQAFADALRETERSGEVAPLVSLFADGATLARPELDHSHASSTDATEFWGHYLGQFTEVTSTFAEVTEAEDVGVLEWTSEATLASGRPITYAGVSLLTFGDDDRVSRFATYYDTAAFLESPEA